MQIMQVKLQFWLENTINSTKGTAYKFCPASVFTNQSEHEFYLDSLNWPLIQFLLFCKSHEVKLQF